MTISPSQKSILITGCSTGIGRCVAESLHQRGYQVFATARNREDIKDLEQRGITIYPLDLTDEDSIESTVTKVLELSGGTLYALFNNGAYGQPGALEDLPVAALRAQFETNLFGTHHLTRLLIPTFRKQGYGRIIQNSSVLGFVSLKYRGAYVASKYALEGLSDTLRLELKGSGVYCSLIQPGPVNTQFRENANNAFSRWIKSENSIHQKEYAKMQKQRLGHKPTPFSVSSEVVLKRVIHALESKHPKARYPVTFPTYLFRVLKRILTSNLLDQLLYRSG